MENGLPIKPLINPEYEIVQYENGTYAIYVYLETEQISNIKKYYISHYLVEENHVIISLDYYNIVFNNIPNIIIKEAQNKKVSFAFYDKNKSFINGIQFE